MTHEIEDPRSSEVAGLIKNGWSFSRENVDSGVLVDPETQDRKVLMLDENGTWQLEEIGTSAEG